MLAVCVIFMACVGQLSFAQHRDDEGRSRDSYPNPRENYGDCARPLPSYVCDPDNIILRYEAEQLNTELINTVQHTKCPCSHFTCSQHHEGYKIGIALTKRMRFDGAESNDMYDEKNIRARQNERKLDEAKKFAHKLLTDWDLDRCDDDVMIFYSHYDKVLYTAVGDVARLKLNSRLIHEIANNTRGHFAPGGNVFTGLLKMVKDYRNVFAGAYRSTGGRTSRIRGRNDAQAHMKSATLNTSLFVILASLTTFSLSSLFAA